MVDNLTVHLLPTSGVLSFLLWAHAVQFFSADLQSPAEDNSATTGHQ